MTEPKWTPGPWKVVRNSRNCTLNVVSAPDADGESVKIALVNYRDEANAHLIAAAPDLYAALDWVENGIPAECFRDDETTQVVFTGKDLKAFARARRKARGE